MAFLLVAFVDNLIWRVMIDNAIDVGEWWVVGGDGSVVLYHMMALYDPKVWMQRGHVWRWEFYQQERPYNHDSTASRLLSEVKHDLARLVLRWGTTLEYLVLFFFAFSTHPQSHHHHLQI